MNIWNIIDTNSVEELTHLVVQGADINVLNSHHQSALYVACDHGHDEIARILLENGAHINNGADPLVIATRNNNVSCVHLLLRYGANASSKDENQISVIDTAGLNQYYLITETLFDYGAYPDNDIFLLKTLGSQQATLARKLLQNILRSKQFSDMRFTSGLHCAFRLGLQDLATQFISECQLQAKQHYAYALCCSAKHNWSDIVLSLMDKGADINECVNNSTALYAACKAGHSAMVSLLLQLGADVNKPVRSYCTCNSIRCHCYIYPIQVAAVTGDIEIVRMLLENGAIHYCQMDDYKFFNAGDFSTEMPIHLAFDNGHMDIVELFVNQGSPVDTANDKGMTPLLKAAQLNCVDAVQRLLILGASASHVNNLKESSLHIAIAGTTAGSTHHDVTSHLDHNYFHNSSLSMVKENIGNEDETAMIVALLLQKDVNINCTCLQGETALYRACAKGLPNVVQILLDAGSDINPTDSYKYPLVIACAHGHASVVVKLLAAGADVNVTPQSNNCLTPLCSAVDRANVEIVNILLKYGASVNLCDASGKSALDHVIDKIVTFPVKSTEFLQCHLIMRALLRSVSDSGGLKRANYCHDSPLYRVCSAGLYDAAKELLSNGASPNHISRGSRSYPIVAACKMNHSRLVELLLQYNALLAFPDVSARQYVLDTYGQHTVNDFDHLLLIAAENGNQKIVKILLSHGVDVNQTGNSEGKKSALHLAANGTVAEILITNGANINLICKSSGTPLSAACSNKRLDVVSVLLQHGADPNTVSSNIPLHAACNNYNTPIIQQLLLKNADVNKTDKKGNTPLHLAINILHSLSKRAVHETNCCSVENVDETVIDSLLSKKACVNICNKIGETPLYVAVSCGLTGVVQKLLDAGADPDMTTKLKFPLLRACINRCALITKLLLSKLANPNISCIKFHGKTPLCIAASHLDIDSVKHLLEYCADVDHSDQNGNTPLHFVLRIKAFHVSANVSSEKFLTQMSLAKILSQFGANLNAVNDKGETPLYLACKHNDADLSAVKMLLAMGADSNVKTGFTGDQGDDRQVKYPLSYAVSINKLELAKLLIANGAVIDNVDGNGLTALHVAIKTLKLMDCCEFKRYDLRMVELLITAGADLNLMDAKGETALYKASERNIRRLVSLLLQHGANPNMAVVDKHPLVAACRHNNFKLVKLLLTNEALPDPQRRKSGISKQLTVPICIAAEKLNFRMMKILIRHGASVNCQELNGKTALHILARHGKSRARRCINLLLKNKANVNILMKNKTSPLFLACKAGHMMTLKQLLRNNHIENHSNTQQPLVVAVKNNSVEMVELLLKRGANPNTPSVCVGHRINWLKMKKLSFELPLCVATDLGYTEIVLCLLDHGANANGADGVLGKTPLHYAIDKVKKPGFEYTCSYSVYQTILEILLKRGADVNIPTSCGETVLYKATLKGLQEVVNELLKLGADPNMHSPLSIACLNEDVKIVDLLLRAGADPNFPRNSIKSVPLLVAVNNSCIEIVELLLKRGCDVNVKLANGVTALQVIVNNIVPLWDAEDWCRSYSVQRLRELVTLFRLLLTAGADPNVVNDSGLTVLERVFLVLEPPRFAYDMRVPLNHEIKRTIIRIIDLLIQHGATMGKVIADEDESERTNIDAKMFLVSVCDGVDDADCLTRLFKAGIGISLLSLCSSQVQHKCSIHCWSSHLCQGLALAGYHFSSMKLNALEQKTSMMPDLSSWMKEDTETPPTLMRLCRVCVRRRLSVSSDRRTVVPLIDQLPIPESVKGYLKFEGPLMEVNLDSTQLRNCLTTYCQTLEFGSSSDQWESDMEDMHDDSYQWDSDMNDDTDHWHCNDSDRWNSEMDNSYDDSDQQNSDMYDEDEVDENSDDMFTY